MAGIINRNNGRFLFGRCIFVDRFKTFENRKIDQQNRYQNKTRLNRLNNNNKWLNETMLACESLYCIKFCYSIQWLCVYAWLMLVATYTTHTTNYQWISIKKQTYPYRKIWLMIIISLDVTQSRWEKQLNEPIKPNQNWSSSFGQNFENSNFRIFIAQQIQLIHLSSRSSSSNSFVAICSSFFLN